MTLKEAIKTLTAFGFAGWVQPNPDLPPEVIDAMRIAIDTLHDKIKAEEDQQEQQETGLFRFYYCESEDSYLLGARCGTMYYAHWDGHSFVWDMSKHLPWGEHIVDETTLWKEHTYPSEPKEIGPDEWANGFLSQQTCKKSCAEENKPLTIEELSTMDGQQVFAAIPMEGESVRVSVNGNIINLLTDDPGGVFSATNWYKQGVKLYRQKPEGIYYEW